MALLEDVARRAYEPAVFGEGDIATALGVIDRYRDLGIGLADTSLVVLADRHDTREIFTLDERHFRTVRALDAEPFRLIPADA